MWGAVADCGHVGACAACSHPDHRRPRQSRAAAPEVRARCGSDPCGRKAGYCPKREQIRREHKSTKSRAGRRTIGLPDPLIKILRQHQEAQEVERIAPGADWEGKGYVFASPTGGPLSPNTDFHVWKRSIMGWEPGGAARMRARYMHVTGIMLRKVAQHVGEALWEPLGSEEKTD